MRGVRESCTPPSPSRHDPWRFLRCVDLRNRHRAIHTTPRLAARVRGKVLHYGVAVPFIAVAAASISQLMHKREAGLGPLEEIPHTLDEPALQFDWEESIGISARARRALDFVARVLRERGTAGQPIWPIVPSSLYHAFTEADFETCGSW